MYLYAITPPPSSTLYNKHLELPGSCSFSIRESSHRGDSPFLSVCPCLSSSFPHHPSQVCPRISPCLATHQEEWKKRRVHFLSIALGKAWWQGPRQLLTPHPQPGSRGVWLPGLTFSFSFSVLDPSSWNSATHIQTRSSHLNPIKTSPPCPCLFPG